MYCFVRSGNVKVVPTNRPLPSNDAACLALACFTRYLFPDAIIDENKLTTTPLCLKLYALKLCIDAVA